MKKVNVKAMLKKIRNYAGTSEGYDAYYEFDLNRQMQEQGKPHKFNVSKDDIDDFFDIAVECYCQERDDDEINARYARDGYILDEDGNIIGRK